MTKRSESERAELVEERANLVLANEAATSWGAAVGARSERIKEIDQELRRLAALDQKPVALAHVRLEDDGLFAELEVIDGTNLQPSMSPIALYLSPPPAAGWDEAIEAAAQIAVHYCASPQCVSDIRALTKSPVVNDYLTTRFEDKDLDAPVKLTVVSWEGRIHCAYINNHRIAGGKPWGGGATEKDWNTSLREVIRAFPDLQKALGFDYLGRASLRHNAPPDSGAGLPPIDESLHTPELIAELQKPAMWLGVPDHGGADAGVGVKLLEWTRESATAHVPETWRAKSIGSFANVIATTQCEDRASPGPSDPSADRREIVAHVKQMRRTMRSARAKGVPMAIWERDLKTMDDVLSVLDCDKQGER